MKALLKALLCEVALRTIVATTAAVFLFVVHAPFVSADVGTDSWTVRAGVYGNSGTPTDIDTDGAGAGPCPMPPISAEATDTFSNASGTGTVTATSDATSSANCSGTWEETADQHVDGTVFTWVSSSFSYEFVVDAACDIVISWDNTIDPDDDLEWYISIDDEESWGFTDAQGTREETLAPGEHSLWLHARHSLSGNAGGPVSAYSTGRFSWSFSCAEVSPLAVDFDSNGLWVHDGEAWHGLTSWNPEGILEAPLCRGLFADFGVDGLWFFDYEGESWTRITTSDPSRMERLGGKLAVQFDSLTGLWVYSCLEQRWTRLTGWSPADWIPLDLGLDD